VPRSESPENNGPQEGDDHPDKKGNEGDDRESCRGVRLDDDPEVAPAPAGTPSGKTSQAHRHHTHECDGISESISDRNSSDTDRCAISPGRLLRLDRDLGDFRRHLQKLPDLRGKVCVLEFDLMGLAPCHGPEEQGEKTAVPASEPARVDLVPLDGLWSA